MPPRHPFVSAIADGGDATLVRPSDWNADHVSPYATGSFTVATGNGSVMVKRLILTSTQRVTLQGTSRLRIV
jgi:hypothetical protein